MKKAPFTRHPDLVDELTESLSSDPMLEKFFIKHDIPNKVIVDHLNDLITFKKEYPLCESCPGLHACKQETYGHQPALNYHHGRITLTYHPCDYLRHAQARSQRRDKVDALYMPKMIRQATLSDFRLNTEPRRELFRKMSAIQSKMRIEKSMEKQSEEPIKGLYIHGSYQKGKTYALSALANAIVENFDKTVLIAYYPDLVREIKASIQKGKVEEMVDTLKNVDVLMLDDIGAESFSPWVRDEVLGPVLQHRLLDNMPTFFSSNLKVSELGKVMTDSELPIETSKAYRIVARIKALTEEFKLH